MPLKNDKIHRDLDRGELFKAFGYALVLVIFFSMVLFYICQCIQKVRIENDINAFINSRADLIQINHKLLLERGFLRSLARISYEARNRFGLVEPEPYQIIILSPEILVE
jgi:hypothetical protein